MNETNQVFIGLLVIVVSLIKRGFVAYNYVISVIRACISPLIEGLLRNLQGVKCKKNQEKAFCEELVFYT